MAQDIAKLCYELYKIDWMRRISADRQIYAYKDWYEKEYEPHVSTIHNTYTGEAEPYYDGLTFENWIEEFGYDGNIYVSYEEFLDTEYQNEEYIRVLLDNAALYLRYLMRGGRMTGNQLKDFIDMFQLGNMPVFIGCEGYTNANDEDNETVVDVIDGKIIVHDACGDYTEEVTSNKN